MQETLDFAPDHQSVELRDTGKYRIVRCLECPTLSIQIWEGEYIVKFLTSEYDADVFIKSRP